MAAWRSSGKAARGAWGWRLLAGALLGLMLALGALVAPGPLRAFVPAASAHALPVREDPPKGAILHAPPPQVHIWFSEDVNPLTSKIVVVDPANREVDSGDSHASGSAELEVSLPLLKSGTYVVFWQTQSADDGHITAGTYLFRITAPDGTVPPVPPVLPTGNFPGAGGAVSGTGDTLDGTAIFQALATWVALLAMTFWVGGLFWETWILPQGSAKDRDLRAAAVAAARRFERLAPNALAVVIIADVAIILGQSAALGGGLAGMFSPTLLRAVLFGSRYGLFWWLRQIVAGAALILYVVADQRGWRDAKAADTEASGAAATAEAIPDWRREVMATLRGVARLPRRLAAGWRGRTWLGRGEVLLALALIVAFALSGHAAAVPAKQFLSAIAVDLLHLVAEAAWLGGLFYIGLVLVPSLRTLRPRQGARVLALGLPEFGAVAIVAATLLAATGSLNTAIRLTSIEQFLTTSYGRTLAIKIEIFLVMAGISAYHAFFLRPRLAAELGARDRAALQLEEPAEPAQVGEELVTASASGSGRVPREANMTAHASGGGDGDRNGSGDEAQAVLVGEGAGGEVETPLSPRARTLEERLRDWLRREALLGGAVLLCVALLGVFAGSLTPAPVTTAGSQQSAPFVGTPQAAGPYTVTLTVAPARFGSNTFQVTIKDAQGKPLSGAGVVLAETMLDMDMGTQPLQLTADPATPGTYSGQGDLDMPGHWQVVVKILPPNSQQTESATFTFSASY